jgi:hypothetical protein
MKGKMSSKTKKLLQWASEVNSSLATAEIGDFKCCILKVIRKGVHI